MTREENKKQKDKEAEDKVRALFEELGFDIVEVEHVNETEEDN